MCNQEGFDLMTDGSVEDHVPETTLLEDAVQERSHGPKPSTSGRPHHAGQSMGNQKHTYQTAGTKGEVQWLDKRKLTSCC